MLNQNASGNLITNEGDIIALREKLKSGGKSFSLNLAYTITEVTKKQVIILPEVENFMKKEPRPEFYKKTN